MENSIEEDIILLKDFTEGNFKRDKLENYKGSCKMGFFYYKDIQQAIEHILKDYKRVLKENKYMHNELNKQQTTINKYAKENEGLKILKSGIQTLQNLGIEDGKYIVMSKTDFLNGSCKHLLDDYIPKQEIKDKIRKNEEIIDISNDGDLIHELLHKNKVYEELLESEE